MDKTTMHEVRTTFLQSISDLLCDDGLYGQSKNSHNAVHGFVLPPNSTASCKERERSLPKVMNGHEVALIR